MTIEEERAALTVCNIAYTAIIKHRNGEPLTDLEVAAGAQVCGELSTKLERLGPWYHLVATDLSLKCREFERIQRARERA